MTEKTRVRLGAYFLFALLLLALPISLALTHLDAVSKSKRWVGTSDGVALLKPTDRAEAVSYVQTTKGLSREAAERVVARRERETGMRIGVPDKMPFGAQIDYYEVDGTRVPNTAQYRGSATVLDPKVPGNAAAVDYWRHLPALKKEAPGFLRFVNASLDKGFLLAPLGMVSSPLNGTPSWAKKGPSTKATTTNIRIAVVCTILPGMRDISPRSDGDTDANDTGSLSIDYTTRTPSATPTEVAFRQIPSDAENAGLAYNYASATDVPAGRDHNYPNSLFDTPGGVFSTGATWGVPTGVPAAWDYTQEAMAPHSSHATNLMLQNDMYDLFFNPAYNEASVANWFYANTHGLVHVDGTTNDIVGWLRSAHQVNRYPYQIGGGNSQFVFPGTPVIRDGVDGTPSPAAGYNAAANQIVRATLSDNGLTILFSHPVLNFGVGGLQLVAYSNSPITTGHSGQTVGPPPTAPTAYTQTNGGYVAIAWGSSTYAVTMDPYDARRWTVTNTGGNGFKYLYYTGNPATPTTTVGTWTPTTGGDWNLAYGGYTDTAGNVLTVPAIRLGGLAEVPFAPPWYTYPGYTLQDQSAAHNGVRQGCPDLQNTLITAADMRVSLYNHHALDASVGFAAPFTTTDTSVGFGGRPFARLKSMWYYTRSYSGAVTRQIAHLNNQWGAGDDISGTAVRPGDPGYAPRVKPFDTGPNDAWNGGYWATGASVREGSSGEYAGDVGMVMQDNGISLSGYQRTIYIAADGGVSAPGLPETTASGFQPSSSLNNFNESGAGVAFHELAHTFGAGDLYDNDLYANHDVPPPVPAFHECYAMGKYSIMDAGGRLDAFHLANMTIGGQPICTPQVITHDTLGVQIPEIESLLRDPVILKIPGNPYYLKKNIPHTAWQEYYLVENRNVNASDGNGGYGFDSSDKGLYIYHIDTRGMARNNTSQAGFQREDDLLSVIIEQADGKYELEFNNKGAAGQAFPTDPFGSNTAARVDSFWQFPMFNNDVNHLGGLVTGVSTAGSPTSYSHGYTRPEYNGAAQNTLIPGTETDSFARIMNISNIGQNMTADVYVEPAELRVTGTSIAPAEVQQGVQDIGFLKVTMENRQDLTAGKTDYSKMSTKDVYVDTLRILESGTSSDGTNLTAVKLYQDAAPENGVLDVPGDALIAQGSVITTVGDRWRDYAVFTNLGYRVPIGQSRTLFIAYDIAPEAQTNPHITVGAEFTDASKIMPRTPGTVEVRTRLDANPDTSGPGDVNAAAPLTGVDPYNFGAYRFPVLSNTSTIVNFPDRLVITPSTAGMPTSASQGQTELPMLRLNCEVNPNGNGRTGGSVRLDNISVNEVGTANALSDISNCKLYMDDGDGVFDYTADTPLGTSSFTIAGTDERAYFPNLNLLINSGTPRNLFLAVSVATTAEVGKSLRLELSYNGAPGPPDPDPADCFVQVINNSTEAPANRDFVEFHTPDATWPLQSQIVNIIVPNQPPSTPIAPFSPNGGQQISDATPTLTWSMPVPPDPDAGDTLATLHYELQVANNASFTGPVSGSTTDGPTPLQWTVPDVSALALNTDYWWRVRAVDAQGATSPWCTGQTFRLVTNRPPNAIAGAFTPQGRITTRTPGTQPPVTTTGPIAWPETTDPDASDAQASLRYVLQVDDNADFSSPLVLTNVVANGGTWDRIITLPDGTSAALSHAAQHDYAVLPGDNLQWGTTYYYRVAARDAADAQSTWSATYNFTPVEDSRPRIPIAAFVPSNDTEITTLNPVVSWHVYDDVPAGIGPDPDATDTTTTLHYRVQLKRAVPDDNADMTQGTIWNWFTTAGAADTNPADGILDAQQWIVDHTAGGSPITLIDNAHYYWRVRAIDDEGLVSDWTDVQSFWVNLVNDPPLPPTAGFTPTNGVQTNDSTPALSWYPGSDPDHSDPASTLHYVVEFSTEADCGVSSYQYTTTDGVTTVTPSTPLTDLTTWYWRVKTIDDDGAESAWSSIQSFNLDVNNQPPRLTNDIVSPMYGPITTLYQLYVTYTDPDAPGDVVGKVYCTIDGTVYEMQKQTPADVTASDGIVFVIGVPGTSLGLGAHQHFYSCDAGARLPATGTSTGPVIGTASRIWFTDLSGAPATTYEEGRPVYVKVQDEDQNLNPAVAETLTVIVTATGGDSELLTLTETGVNTSIFRGSLPTRGAAGASNNGTLNAIGGPSGNLLTATYTDPDDSANPAPDTVSTTATLYDTVAPAEVGKKLIVTSGPDGRDATLNWSTYDESLAVDVAGYHVYYADVPFTTTSGLPPADTLGAGVKTTNITGLTPNKSYWFAVVPFDEVPNERTDVTAVKLITRDTSAPIISGQTPANGASEVALDSSVSFSLSDAGVGIDRRTLVVTLTQNGQPVACNPLTVGGDKANMTVTVTPTAPFSWNGVVTVTLDVMDLDGNQLVITDWIFSLVTDTEVPTLDQQSPAPGATNVPVTNTISFHLKDNKSGIDPASIHVEVNGNDVTSALSLGGTPLDTTVLYDPGQDLLFSSTYTIVVTACDAAGNALPATTWSFDTVVDNSGVTIDQYDPARNAVDVPIDTNISMRLSDTQAGIDRSSFRMTVEGTDVTSDVTITQNPAAPATPTTMNVVYNPATDFPYATDINVGLSVRDGVGNVTSLTYKFTTVAAPTYNIAGVITHPADDANTDDDGLAGVTVTATSGGVTVGTAITDGTGGYRITGVLAGTYVVTPARSEYVFAPASQTVTVGGTQDDATGVNFVGTLQTYSVRGTVKIGTAALAGVTVTCDGKQATTDADGVYVITGLSNGQYTLTPTLANYHFQPTSRAVQVASANVSGMNFQAIPDTFTITGTVYDNVGNRLQGAQVACGGNTAVTNAAGQYILTGLTAGDYTLSVTKAGYAFTPGTRTVQVPPAATDIDFTAYIDMAKTFPAGYNLLGVPGTPADSDPTTIFRQASGDPVVECFRWNPEASPARYLVAINDPEASAVQVKAGRGFFVRFDQATTLHVAGTPTDTARTTSIGLSEGWNMIANPSSLPLKWSRFVPSITDGIRPFAFVYDTVTGSYKMVSAEASVSADRDTLMGWEGAWVRATTGGVSLLVNNMSSAGEPVARPAQASLNGGWVIPIVAKAGRRADYTSVAGAVPGSDGKHTIENPPTAPSTVDVYFTNTAGARLAHDIRSDGGAQTYQFVVSCAVPNSKVTVSLPDLSQVPATMQVTLVDEAAGKTLYARTMQGYTYDSKGDNSERSFKLIVTPRDTAALAVTASAEAAKGAGAMVTYKVTKACQVSIRVLNLAGRTVKTLAAGKAVTAGVQSELWNLTSENGTAVPAGVYLLQIDAATEDGQQVRGLTQVRVDR